MTHTLRFQTYTFPQEQLKIDNNFADLVAQSTRLIGLSGGFDEDGGDPAPAAIGKVTANFAISWEEALRRHGYTSVTDSNIEDAVQREMDAIKQMAAWGTRRLYYKVGTLAERFCEAKINYISDAKAPVDGNFYQAVQVTFRVDDPHWYTNGTEAWTWGDGTIWGSSPWGGSAVPLAVAGLQTDWVETINGSAATYPRVTLTCGAGESMLNPTLQRFDAVGNLLDEFSYIGTLSAGDTLEVNCRAASVKKNGVDAFAATTFSSLNPDFFRLAPGANNLRLTLGNSGNAGEITLRYFEVYK